MRWYSHLFTVEEPTEEWEQELNPESEVVCTTARVDPSLVNWDPKVESSFQVRERDRERERERERGSERDRERERERKKVS